MRGDAIPCRSCGDLQMPRLVFSTDRRRWRLILPYGICRPCVDAEYHFYEVCQR